MLVAILNGSFDCAPNMQESPSYTWTVGPPKARASGISQKEARRGPIKSQAARPDSKFFDETDYFERRVLCHHPDVEKW